MNELNAQLKEILESFALLSGALTAPRTRLLESLSKVEITPVTLRGVVKYQLAYYRNKQVTHRNLTAEEAQAEIVTLLSSAFKQALFHTATGDIHVLLNKRDEVTLRRTEKTDKETRGQGGKERETAKHAEEREKKTVDRSQQSEEHNSDGVPEYPNTRTPEHSTLIPSFPHDRVKNHILPEGQPLPFLVRLGVMSGDGKVIAARRDKFRQINRFLEMVADVMEPLLAAKNVEATGENCHSQGINSPLRIVDFGCGKGYLTFALYHYLHVVRGLDVSLVGVDIKQDVLNQLSALAHELNYTGLSFVVSDIRSFALPETSSPEEDESLTEHPNTRTPEPPVSSVDMAVALHACDTATDDALVQAIAWNARVILAAPCCQHELFSQLQNDALHPMLRQGILRERLSALVTDALRAEYLIAHGYAVQLLEFVDAEHTPKNILIRAVRPETEPKPERQQQAQDAYARFRDFWHVQPYIEQALAQAMSKR